MSGAVNYDPVGQGPSSSSQGSSSSIQMASYPPYPPQQQQQGPNSLYVGQVIIPNQTMYATNPTPYPMTYSQQPQAYIPNAAPTVNGFPVNTQFVNPGRARPSNQWADGFCSCCSNIFPSCYCASFCCYGQYILAQISEKTSYKPFKAVMYGFLLVWIISIILMFLVSPNLIVWIPAICTALFAATMRVHIVNRDGIKECSRDPNCNSCGEWCQGCLCLGCNTCQMARHVYGYTEVFDGDSKPDRASSWSNV